MSASRRSCTTTYFRGPPTSRSCDGAATHTVAAHISIGTGGFPFSFCTSLCFFFLHASSGLPVPAALAAAQRACRYGGVYRLCGLGAGLSERPEALSKHSLWSVWTAVPLADWKDDNVYCVVYAPRDTLDVHVRLGLSDGKPHALRPAASLVAHGYPYRRYLPGRGGSTERYCSPHQVPRPHRAHLGVAALTPSLMMTPAPQELSKVHPQTATAGGPKHSKLALSPRHHQNTPRSGDG